MLGGVRGRVAFCTCNESTVRKDLGRVVRKPVNVNPGLKVN